MRFCHGLTHQNTRNSVYGFSLVLCLLHIDFSSTPLSGVGLTKLNSNFAKNLVSYIEEKSMFQINKSMRLEAIS